MLIYTGKGHFCGVHGVRTDGGLPVDALSEALERGPRGVEGRQEDGLGRCADGVV